MSEAIMSADVSITGEQADTDLVIEELDPWWGAPLSTGATQATCYCFNAEPVAYCFNAPEPAYCFSSPEHDAPHSGQRA